MRALEGAPREVVVGQMFFDLWRTRQSPFRELADGDTMLMFDTRSRRLVWEFRAAAVNRAQYHSIPDALDILRARYGLVDAELTSYIWQRPSSGWLLAWAAEVVRPLDVQMATGFRMTEFGGRNGYVALDAVPVALRPKLPPPSVEPILSLPFSYVGGLETAEAGSRYIPVAVRRAVWDRDGGKCVVCGRSSGEVQIHFDHLYPHSRGGTNDAENLQLLCRDHNLSKAARVIRGLRPPSELSLRHVWADQLGLSRGTSLDELLTAVENADGEPSDILHDEGHRGDFEAVSDFLDQHPDLIDHDLISANVAWRLWDRGDTAGAVRRARGLVRSADQRACQSASLLVAIDLDQGEERTRLLGQATQSDDPWVRAAALLGIGADQLAHGAPADARANLQRALADGNATVRSQAALLLFELRRDVGETNCHEDLEQLLRIALAGDDEIRAWAAFYLVEHLADELDDAVARSLLAIASQNEDLRSNDRLKLYSAAVESEEEKARDELLKLLESEDPEVRRAASDILEGTNP